MKLFYFQLLILLFSTMKIAAQTLGCTDPLAINYNVGATLNDGSCIYPTVRILPSQSFILSDILRETSGLIQWNNQLWTQNDDSDINLYSLKIDNATIIQSYPLNGIINNDWEEISQDNDYIYIGDFGNNAKGNRTDLKILRIEKNSILNSNPIIDSIKFSYSDQLYFDPKEPNTTDFDCEAFIVFSDKIYLFTKQWTSNQTTVYSLPKTPGTYTATPETTFNVEGLLTGAVFLESKKIVVLCGYSNLLEPFIYLLYSFNDTNFFSGNKRKIYISLPFHQIEGVSTINGLTYYISNENFTQPPFINIPQKLHVFDLSTYLSNYLDNLHLSSLEIISNEKVSFFPNPVLDVITVKLTKSPTHYYLINTLGQTVMTGILTTRNSSINMGKIKKGMYFLKVEEKKDTMFKIIKK